MPRRPACFAASRATYLWHDARGQARGSGAPRWRSVLARHPYACAYARLDALEASNVPCDRDVSPLGAPPRHFSRRAACRQRHEAFVRGTRQRPRRWSRTTAAGSRSRLRLQDRLRKTPLDEPGWLGLTSYGDGVEIAITAVHRFLK